MDADAIARFLKVTERAVQFILNHPEEGWEAYVSYAPELDDELNRRAWGDTYPRFATRPAAFDAGRYRDFEAFLAGAGMIEGEAPVSALAIDVTAR